VTAAERGIDRDCPPFAPLPRPLADVTRDFAGSTVYFVIRKADLAKRDFSRVSHL
jgi:hypothetical protein